MSWIKDRFVSPPTVNRNYVTVDRDELEAIAKDVEAIATADDFAAAPANLARRIRALVPPPFDFASLDWMRNERTPEQRKSDALLREHKARMAAEMERRRKLDADFRLRVRTALEVSGQSYRPAITHSENVLPSEMTGLLRDAMKKLDDGRASSKPLHTLGALMIREGIELATADGCAFTVTPVDVNQPGRGYEFRLWNPEDLRNIGFLP